MKKRYIVILSLMLSCFLVACGINQQEMVDVENSAEEDETEEIPVGVADAVENISDFKAELKPVDTESVNSNTVISFDQAEASFKLDFNHQDDIYEINFYRVSDNQYDIEQREYLATYFNYYPMNQAYIRYDVPDSEPNMMVSFVTSGGQIFNYYIKEKTGSLEYLGEEDNSSMVSIVHEDN